jgi:hypothetical protein
MGEGVTELADALPGLEVACHALAAGRAVVLPNAPPLAYIVVATSPHEVNRLKGRPLEQNVGITLSQAADWRALRPALDVAPDGFARMITLMRRELLSFLAPVRDGAELPGWIRPAVRDGWLGLFAGRWRPLAPRRAPSSATPPWWSTGMPGARMEPRMGRPRSCGSRPTARSRCTGRAPTMQGSPRRTISGGWPPGSTCAEEPRPLERGRE